MGGITAFLPFLVLGKTIITSRGGDLTFGDMDIMRCCYGLGHILFYVFITFFFKGKWSNVKKFEDVL